MEKPIIGIIGNGFVGNAIANGCYQRGYNYKVFDKLPQRCLHDFVEVVAESDIIFICVPTPSNNDGSCDIRAVDEVASLMAQSCKLRKSGQVLALKSTVPPGTTDMLNEKYNLNMVFNPEFLRAKYAKYDFMYPDLVVVGANRDEELFKVLDFYRGFLVRDTDWDWYECVTNLVTAELVKYMLNCFLATKISFLNEMKQISDKCGADWDGASYVFGIDKRVGKTHNDVPGHDGKLGFGGACFPKDIKALINFAQTLGIDPKVLNGALNKNLEVRKEE